MKRVMVIEVSAKTTFDEEATLMWESFTSEQRSERLDEMKAEVCQMFVREMADDSEIDVTIHVEEDVN